MKASRKRRKELAKKVMKKEEKIAYKDEEKIPDSKKAKESEGLPGSIKPIHSGSHKDLVQASRGIDITPDTQIDDNRRENKWTTEDSLGCHRDGKGLRRRGK